MTDYAKVTTRALYSKNSDYSDPKVDTQTLLTTLTPDEYIHQELQIDIGGNTIDTDLHMATVTTLIVRNNDATNYVTITGESTSATTFSIDILAGGVLVMADCAFDETTNLVLTADTASVEVEMFYCGT